MCGICGIIRLDGVLVSSHELETLTSALAHRGPDGGDTFMSGSVGFGHRRLKILDLTEAAKQPMLTEDQKIALTFNGEIYNYKELRADLVSRGVKFRSTGDTEVLLRLYEAEGEACFQKLRGMFAFAMYDQRRQKVLLVRDRLGKKPLIYFQSRNSIAFSSEIKALRTLKDCSREFDREDIHHYLTMMYVPSPHTGFKNLYKLPAAHILTIDLAQGSSNSRRYWQLNYSINHQRPLSEWKEMVTSVLDESVRLRLESDVPIGAFLSGGVDSSAIVAFMSRHTSKPVETFSIGTTEASHNELPLAQSVAKKFGTNHHPIVAEPDIVHLLPELVRVYEQPFADPSVIPTYLIAKETRKFVTVALNGDGGDENFAGYVRYPILQFSRLWGSVPFIHPIVKVVCKQLFHMHASTLFYRSLRFQSTIHRSLAQRQLEYLSFFTEEEKSALYNSAHQHIFSPSYDYYERQTHHARSSSPDWLSAALASDVDTYLADDLLPKVDLGTMAHGLEARSPFLDHTLLELTATMPPVMKLRGITTKWFLKHLLRGTIPDEVLDRPKSGFRLPLNHWFRTSLRPFMYDRLLSTSSPLWTMFDRSQAEVFLNSYIHSSIDYSDHIWALLWLDEWMRQFS